MSAAMTERLVAVAQAARRAGHGARGTIYAAACAELGLSRATLLRRIKEVAVTDTRKRRTDAGKTALTREDATMISATLMEATRKNGKRLYSIADAVTMLRANGEIDAGRLDENTGEWMPLSESTISRALRGYGLHPDQLSQPTPVTELASLHPNHVWEIDASLCTLYYLSNGHRGLQVMDSATFYKNKPKNVARVSSERVWSYELTDHTSGWIYVEYVMGAESGENLCSVLINAMQERGGADVLHGVPRMLYLDPGSANTAAMTKNLCRSLGIELVSHKPHNARATGQVEKARDIIERRFEPGLRFQPVHSLDELNDKARLWRQHFNATAIHTRYGKPRSNAWMAITADQLIKAPPVEVCRELAVATPVSRKVTSKLRVPFHGIEYDVSSVPGVMVGEKLLMTRNPWRSDAAQVVLTGEDGHPYFHLVDEVKKNEYGFAENATIVGQGHTRHADTPAQVAAKRIEQLVTSTGNEADAMAVRKAKSLPFGGRLDPYKPITDSTLPAFLPRRGHDSPIRAPYVEKPRLTHVEAAKALKAQLPEWNTERYQALVSHWPEGLTEDELRQAMLFFSARPQLSVIGS